MGLGRSDTDQSERRERGQAAGLRLRIYYGFNPYFLFSLFANDVGDAEAVRGREINKIK